MGALEAIDWDELDGEIFSVIAHASAGTDFCSPDLQITVDGCIAEMKRALKAVEENSSSHNSESAPCEVADSCPVHRCRECKRYYDDMYQLT
jgi:hypothetical protein